MGKKLILILLIILLLGLFYARKQKVKKKDIQEKIDTIEQIEKKLLPKVEDYKSRYEKSIQKGIEKNEKALENHY